MAGKPRTIDEYLAALSDEKRAALERLRKTIRGRPRRRLLKARIGENGG
jgi:hypothetical protein